MSLSEICLLLLVKYAEYVGVCFCNTMTQALEYYEKKIKAKLCHCSTYEFGFQLVRCVCA